MSDSAVNYWGVRSILAVSDFINTTIDPLLSSGGTMTQLSSFQDFTHNLIFTGGVSLSQ